MNYEIKEIKELNIPELALYTDYTENQLYHIKEPGPGVFIAETPMVIERALADGYQPISMLMEAKYLDQLEGLLGNIWDEGHDRSPESTGNNSHVLPIYVADLSVISQLTGYNLTRGMLCAMRRRPLPQFADLIRDKSRIAILEDINNPTNVGAIIRSAAALGIEAVVLTSASSDPLYRRAARVSMGTVFQVPWTVIDEDYWQKEAGNLLHQAGFKTAAMALVEDAMPISDARVRSENKLAIILGTEGTGLTKETIEQADYKVIIPMTNGVDSLNVAAASAVVFWELGEKR